VLLKQVRKSAVSKLTIFPEKFCDDFSEKSVRWRLSCGQSKMVVPVSHRRATGRSIVARATSLLVCVLTNTATALKSLLHEKMTRLPFKWGIESKCGAAQFDGIVCELIWNRSNSGTL
jgi:hypothetical protein